MSLSRRLACLPFAVLLGCTGGHRSGDRAGTINWTMTLLPATPSLIAGQSVQFSASTPWGNEAQWSVLPATAGLITPGGLFTAANTPGPCTVYAAWSKDVRYIASTTVTIRPIPAAAVISPSLVQAFGAQQAVTGTSIANGAVVGESVPATTATTADQAVKVRHGFDPPK
ncbi:MAG: hypothetical protein HGB30_13440 [Holophagaceae bacterium]|nr:hypothetical protein [Holophagaceae bacterium]